MLIRADGAVFEWEDVDQSSAPQPDRSDSADDPDSAAEPALAGPPPPVYVVRKDELLDLWTVLDARSEWYAAWSRTTLGGSKSDALESRASTGDTNAARNHRSFGIRISTVSSSSLCGLTTGVTAAPRDQLKLRAPSTWGCAETDLTWQVLRSAHRGCVVCRMEVS